VRSMANVSAHRNFPASEPQSLAYCNGFPLKPASGAGELSVGRRVSHSDVDVLSSQQVYEPREAGMLPPSQVDLQSRLATKRNEAKCRGERGLV
jgi:hypothetical protein